MAGVLTATSMEMFHVSFHFLQQFQKLCTWKTKPPAECFLKTGIACAWIFNAVLVPLAAPRVLPHALSQAIVPAVQKAIGSGASLENRRD
jgi:hypothetical protein